MSNGVILILGYSRRYFFLADELKKQGILDGIIYLKPTDVMRDEEKSPLEEAHFKRRDEAEDCYFGEVDIEKICLETDSCGITTMSEEMVPFIRGKSSNCIITYGVGYIRESILKMFPENAFNIHNGLIPWYKGAACHFWPFYFLEPTYVGCTLHRLAKKLDGGNIIHQCVPQMDFGDDAHDLSCKASKKMCQFVADNIGEICKIMPEGVVVKKSGKMFYAKDFREEHLGVIYKYYENKIVDEYLSGKIKCDVPELIEFKTSKSSRLKG